MCNPRGLMCGLLALETKVQGRIEMGKAASACLALS